MIAEYCLRDKNKTKKLAITSFYKIEPAFYLLRLTFYNLCFVSLQYLPMVNLALILILEVAFIFYMLYFLILINPYCNLRKTWFKMVESIGLLLVAFAGLFFEREFKEQNVNVSGVTQLLLILLIIVMLTFQFADFVDQTMLSYKKKKERENIEKEVESLDWIRIKNIVYSRNKKTGNDGKYLAKHNQVMPYSVNSNSLSKLEIGKNLNASLREINPHKFAKKLGGNYMEFAKKNDLGEAELIFNIKKKKKSNKHN